MNEQPPRPTSDERTYGAQGGGYRVAPEDRLAEPNRASYFSRTVVVLGGVAGALTIASGIAGGLHESHIGNTNHMRADHAYTTGDRTDGIQFEKEAQAHLDKADNLKAAGWGIGLGSISVGIIAGGFLRKKENAENERRREDYFARVQAHVDQQRPDSK